MRVLSRLAILLIVMIVAFSSGAGSVFAQRDGDGDSVLDPDDRCPNEFGSPNLQGCPDRDGDGFADIDDQCPDVPGLREFGGCPPPPPRDRDGDGVPDDSDACPDTPGSPNFGGCPDGDGDGVPDPQDRCPQQPGDPNNAGCPLPTATSIPDRDGDGVLDPNDACPDTPGSPNFNGCPPPTDIPVLPTNTPVPPDRDGDGFADNDDRCPDDRGTPNLGRGDCGDPDGDFITNDGDVCPNVAGPAETGGCPPPTPTPSPTLTASPTLPSPTQTPAIVTFQGDAPEYEISIFNLPESYAESLIDQCEIQNLSGAPITLYNVPIWESGYSNLLGEFYNNGASDPIDTLEPNAEATVLRVFWYPYIDGSAQIWVEVSDGWLYYWTSDLASYESAFVPFFPDLPDGYTDEPESHLAHLYALNCEVEFSYIYECLAVNLNPFPVYGVEYVGETLDDVNVLDEAIPPGGLRINEDQIRYYWDEAVPETYSLWLTGYHTRLYLGESLGAGSSPSEVGETLAPLTLDPDFQCQTYGLQPGGNPYLEENSSNAYTSVNTDTLVGVRLAGNLPGLSPTATPGISPDNIPELSEHGFFPLDDGLLILGDGSVRPNPAGEGAPTFVPGGVARLVLSRPQEWGDPHIIDIGLLLPAVNEGALESITLSIDELLADPPEPDADPPELDQILIGLIPLPDADANTAYFLLDGVGESFIIAVHPGGCNVPSFGLVDLDGDGILDFCSDFDGDGDTDTIDFAGFFPEGASQRLPLTLVSEGEQSIGLLLPAQGSGTPLIFDVLNGFIIAVAEENGIIAVSESDTPDLLILDNIFSADGSVVPGDDISFAGDGLGSSNDSVSLDFFDAVELGQLFRDDTGNSSGVETDLGLLLRDDTGNAGAVIQIPGLTNKGIIAILIGL